MTETVTEITDLTALFPYEEPSDGQHARAHIVNPPKNLHIWQEGMSAREMVEIARTTGQELVALCGYRWVPRFNPENLDACDTCLAIAGELMRGAGE